MSTRDEILDAAALIYAEHGPNGLSMRRVAKSVGVSATAIYRHFEDKEQLVIEVCSKAARIFENYLVTALSAPTAEQRMTALGRRYRDFGLEQPAYYRALFMSAHPEFERLRDETTREFGATFRMLVDRVADSQREGLIADGDPLFYAVTIWAHVHGLVSLYLDHHMADIDVEAFHELFDGSTALLMKGLRG